jgi:hypothetical protein
MRFLSWTRRLSALAAAAVVVCAAQAGAQANLSTQGFGFPPGQFSTRTWGTGGAIAELDPFSPVNPASIALQTSRIITFQIEPELRTVKSPGGSERTTTARYPNISVAFPVGKGVVLGLGASTLLDRTSTTEFNTNQVLDNADTVPIQTRYRIDGAMSDVRLAAGWNATRWLRLGLGAHAITGHNLVEIGQTFDDTSQFADFSQSIVLSFSGYAASAGLQAASKNWTLALSGRFGGDLRATIEDTTLSKARVPLHFGGALAYTGIANSAIAIRTAHDSWSDLDGLGTAGLKGVDSWDSSIGADFAGPRLGSRTIFLRTGYRIRTLPFQAFGLDGVAHDVDENSVSGGLGTTFANGRVLTDFAAIYANRSAGLPVSEHAWTLSIGISIRP